MSNDPLHPPNNFPNNFFIVFRFCRFPFAFFYARSEMLVASMKSDPPACDSMLIRESSKFVIYEDVVLHAGLLRRASALSPSDDLKLRSSFFETAFLSFFFFCFFLPLLKNGAPKLRGAAKLPAGYRRMKFRSHSLGSIKYSKILFYPPTHHPRSLLDPRDACVGLCAGSHERRAKFPKLIRINHAAHLAWPTFPSSRARSCSGARRARKGRAFSSRSAKGGRGEAANQFRKIIPTAIPKSAPVISRASRYTRVFTPMTTTLNSAGKAR